MKPVSHCVARRRARDSNPEGLAPGGFQVLFGPLRATPYDSIRFQVTAFRRARSPANPLDLHTFARYRAHGCVQTRESCPTKRIHGQKADRQSSSPCLGSDRRPARPATRGVSRCSTGPARCSSRRPHSTGSEYRRPDRRCTAGEHHVADGAKPLVRHVRTQYPAIAPPNALFRSMQVEQSQTLPI